MHIRDIPLDFVDKARGYIADTGKPLLEYSNTTYLATIYAVSWDRRTFVLQTVPGVAEQPFWPLGQYLAFREESVDEFIESHGDMRPDMLDQELPLEFREFDDVQDVTGDIFHRLQARLWPFVRGDLMT